MRAVSILLVMFSHVLQTYHWAKDVPFVWRLTPGATGVSVFFVISGYLITTLLVREQVASGRTSLRGFIFRRMFRILPAYLVFLTGVTLLKFFGLLKVEWLHFLMAALYITDYVQVNWTLLHTWSLSVEEQFYLLYHALLARIRRPTVLKVLVATLFLSIMARLGNQVLGIWPIDATYSFEGRADQLALGCLCALAQQHGSFALKWRLNQLALPIGSLLFVIAIALPVGHTRTLFFNTLMGFAITLVMYAFTTRRQLWLTRLLEKRLLRLIGLISYSLYLWPQIWLAPELSLPLPIALAGAFATGVASYWFVERTGFKFRRRLERKGRLT